MNTYTKHHAISYHSDAPAWLDEFCAVPEMQRLRGVGMNCGCEYTAFPRFLGLPRYSRFRHSVGVCLITWHFTGEIEQALAALFHDISTPSFAHTVDFLHGDYLRQEYTEGRTAAMITQSPEIMALLGKYGVAPDAVTDYHLYPIADNDSPRLSADRLEYTLGNLAVPPRRASGILRRAVRRLRARRRPGACVPTCGHRRGFCARRTEDVPHIRVRRGSLRYAAAGRASAARS